MTKIDNLFNRAMEANMKFCKDCIYYVNEYERCKKHPDLITGKADGNGWRGSARLQRHDGFVWALIMNTCSSRGRWFKHK